MSEVDPKLLNSLRIRHDQREGDGRGPGFWWPVAGGAILVAAVLAGAGWWYAGARTMVVKTAPAVAPAAAAGAGAILQATGYVTARRRATVSTQITGTLTEVLIEEGDHVKKGQVIARLEDSALRASLRAAQAAVSAARAQVVQVQAQLDQAEADWRRTNTLAARGLVAQQAAEQARTAVATYQAQLEARRRDADALTAQAAQAQVNLDYSVVRAPFAGVVTNKAAQVGEIVSPLSAGGGFTRTGVGTIVDMESLEIEVDVNEAYIAQVKPDMPAEAVLDAYADWKIPAHVIAIVPAADRGKATVKVRVALDAKDARIVPDMGARVSFLAAGQAAQAKPPVGVLVPPEAIVQRDGRSVVFVVAEGRAALRRVAPATQTYGAMKLLPEAVAVGERVVLAPLPELRDGASVKSADEAR